MKALAIGIAILATTVWTPYDRPGEHDSNQSPDAFVAMLEGYGEGRVMRLEVKSVDNLRAALETVGRSWVNAGPPGDRSRRQNVLTLVALNGALAASPSQSGQIGELIEWACALLRSDKPSEFERTWMLSTIAQAESARQEHFLNGNACPPASPDCGHARHAISRFPDDPRFKAVPVFGRIEVNVLTRRPVRNSDALVSGRTALAPILNPLGANTQNNSSQKRLSDTFAKLRQLTADPKLRSIARVRLGILHYEMGQLKDSRRELGAALKDAADPFLAYLSHLVMGLGFDSEDQRDDARRSFEAAVALDPGITSGALELATHNFGRGLRTEATGLLDRALATKPVRDDPWQRPCPDCGGWSRRLDELHAAVRR